MSNALNCFTSLHGTDCPIQQPSPFRSSYYSEKLNSAALRYEIGVSIGSSRLVSVSGPCKAGDFPDISIFRQTIQPNLLSSERAITDVGTRTTIVFNVQYNLYVQKHFHRRVRGRHEIVNSYFKKFTGLSVKFRHDLIFDSTSFMSSQELFKICFNMTKPYLMCNKNIIQYFSLAIFPVLNFVANYYVRE